MHLDWSTFALQLVNFAILVWLLARFLYRPVLRQVDARRAAIEAERVEAARMKQSACAERAALEAARAGVANERAAALTAAAAQAEEAAAARRAQAERDAQALIEATRKSLTEERKRAAGALSEAALDLTVELTERLLAELPAELRDGMWLEPIAQHLAALPAQERAALVGDLEGGATLRVVTASELSSDRAAAWRTRLRGAVGRDISISFERDPTLIAGAELHLPHSTFGMGLRGLIESLRGGSRAHARPR